ncbi:MAG: class I SAM-dependent methyltransferase [Bacteroidetes bacterium]|nr:MAG: class I SAM-dependent methyltransferase [Bacteroidota bacterium]
MSNCCSIEDKESGKCGESKGQSLDQKQHWNNAYLNSPEERLGWYETDPSPTLGLIEKAGLNSDAFILNVGAGSTTLVDELIRNNYQKLIATDISDVALQLLMKRVGTNRVEYIVDDLTAPDRLLQLDPVDMWIDRAVLHFFLEEHERSAYFELLKKVVKRDGFVILAQFSIGGAAKCSGLPVVNYNKEMLAENLGKDFELIESFDHTYIMPSGGERPYVYTLFKRVA